MTGGTFGTLCDFFRHVHTTNIFPTSWQRNSRPEQTSFFPFKASGFYSSDIENEPDDQESLVRYLFETRGICAVTSAWLPTRTAPESMHKITRHTGLWSTISTTSTKMCSIRPRRSIILHLQSSGQKLCFLNSRIKLKE
ncbi:hypothetical protein V1508DRAFT_33297 [Lipomyces doorenjongii]|uniref:uncharacterized protein n=1 Tax=Lipomyces doorenjongii TaxID=383834 RepID=UPI0034CF35C3